MAEQERRQPDLDHHRAITAGAAQQSHETRFQEMNNADGEKDDVFVNFAQRRQKGKPAQEGQPKKIKPPRRCPFRHRATENRVPYGREVPTAPPGSSAPGYSHPNNSS